jgi:hypothetical protein
MKWEAYNFRIKKDILLFISRVLCIFLMYLVVNGRIWEIYIKLKEIIISSFIFIPKYNTQLFLNEADLPYIFFIQTMSKEIIPFQFISMNMMCLCTKNPSYIPFHSILLQYLK